MSPSFQLVGSLSILSALMLFASVCSGFIQTSYAQTDVTTSEQTTLSGDLDNNPVAQDILRKIEQTKKMIEDLQQKEYEKNQAQENLEKIRKMSITQLTQDLEEWERMWEKYSSRNAFDSFVSKRPDYVQGVFWDQFEFKEQKVDAGRNAMNQVLLDGGTMEEANNAYHKMASTSKIELIEMNAQFNVKHNLADYAEQQVFNSTGQIHMSPVIQSKLSQYYTDYKLQPNYVLANSDVPVTTESNSEIRSDTHCGDGLVLVSRITSQIFSCVDEFIAKKWVDDGVKGIVIHDESISNIPAISNVKTNPGTKCDAGYVVVYIKSSSEYQCVLESTAQEMINNDIAEIHTITEYALNKDKHKITDDKIYDINQKILQINAEFDLKKKTLESGYDDRLESEQLLAKQKMQEIIKKYKIDQTVSKEDVTKIISEIRDNSDHIKEELLKEKSNVLSDIESELKNILSKTVKGYEDNPSIHVDWNYIDDHDAIMEITSEETITYPVKVLSLDQNYSDDLHLDNVGLVNSFGQKFDEIKSEQVLQVTADITNFDDEMQDFLYMVEIKNKTNDTIQPAKWMTGTLNSNQTLNVGLSWIPKETGQFMAIISLGNGIDSVSEIADVSITVNPKGNTSDDSYCKQGYELLFKYTDNSPICVSANTAFKLINIGMAFA